MIIAYGGTRVQAWVALADRLGVSRWWCVHFAVQMVLQGFPASWQWAYVELVAPSFVEALERAKAQGLGKGRGVKSNRHKS